MPAEAGAPPRRRYAISVAIDRDEAGTVSRGVSVSTRARLFAIGGIQVSAAALPLP
ncbi:hypothetical protein [Tabrizicola flagellatus]|uniref:hypothetical protein n=1 Tax=Tabrizicola flagellatus TaxID=2593021 RepID=UPI00135781FF|nr:hypothetical protein [Tabrizicola flagellatus]